MRYFEKNKLYQTEILKTFHKLGNNGHVLNIQVHTFQTFRIAS